jgi:hypothetical protein
VRADIGDLLLANHALGEGRHQSKPACSFGRNRLRMTLFSRVKINYESVRAGNLWVADMKLASWLIGISCAAGTLSAGTIVFSQPANQPAKQVAQHPASQWATIQNYCFGCHNPGVKAGNLFLSELNEDSVPAHPEIFEKYANCAGARCRHPAISSPRSRKSMR